MEKFIHGEIDREALEGGIQQGLEPLQRLVKDLRVDMAKVQSAFDLAQQILNHTLEDPTYFSDDDKLKERFTAVVYDAWGNLNGLQTEMQANRMTLELLHILQAVKDDEMSPD